MKNHVLPLTMLMDMKRSGNLESRGCTNVIYHEMFTDKCECSSPAPVFCSLECVCRIIAKERHNVAVEDLTGFFPQTNTNNEKLLLLKMTGAALLLLAESDLKKIKKHLLSIRMDCQHLRKFVLY